MPNWTAEELRELDRTSEIRVAGRRKDGSLRTLVIVWHVVVDGVLYARSVKGPEGQWYRGVVRHMQGAISWNGTQRDVSYTRDDAHDAAIDTAYFAKYGNGSASRSITSALATQTTLRIDPR